MENEVLLKALEKLFDEKLSSVYQQLDSINSRLGSIELRLDSIEKTQQTILTFIKEVDKEFYKVEETYKFMNDLKSVMSR
ncbi:MULTISPECIES: hypothetical protein [Caloramator]|uniref:Uncharacterized protein n=1 Tax=Caloramator proteoclasticus DSM 10124 TaxID=1121262 RepID=A0A1M5C4G0_9CLOT|nr:MULTISPECIES: hypothetical protein [Caloramator]SHF49654.1 hypothetical protein SAMN02746091_02647 [Caloramator proteoclasticus DSM 10124]